MEILKRFLRKSKGCNLPYTLNENGEVCAIREGVVVNRMDSCVLNQRGWGRSIKWFDYKTRCIVGWMPYREKPKKGELMLARLKSGRIGTYLIKSVEYEKDPHDMFFADLQDIGYLKDSQ